MRKDSDEPGAAKHRYKEERIDRSKGTAAGFIAKYIGGFDLTSDIDGGEPKSAAERVRAWASGPSRPHSFSQLLLAGGNYHAQVSQPTRVIK